MKNEIYSDYVLLFFYVTYFKMAAGKMKQLFWDNDIIDRSFVKKIL